MYRLARTRVTIVVAAPPLPDSFMPRCHFSALLILLLAPAAHAQNDVGPAAETPVAVWHFNRADEPGVAQSAARFLEAGPRPPTYPAFPATNSAMAFTTA